MLLPVKTAMMLFIELEKNPQSILETHSVSAESRARNSERREGRKGREERRKE